MPKTDKNLKTLRDKVKTVMNTDADYKVNKLPVKIIARFGRHITVITDSRAQWDIQYSLSSIIIMAFLAVLAGADSWVDIESFCAEKKEWLSRFIELPNGRTPCNDTFMRVFAIIDPEEFSKACVDFLTENLSDIKRGLGIASEKRKHIAIDGKQERGTGRLPGTDKEIKDQQTLHFFETTEGICLFSRRIDEKTNEIPVAQELLSGMDTLKDSVISGDALHTQWKHTQIITEKDGDYVFGLKGNQSALKDEAVLLFTNEYMNELKKNDSTYFTVSEQAHNQIEKRDYYLSLKAPELPSAKEGKWYGLKSILCVVKTIENLVTSKVTSETRYYISSLTDIEDTASVVRAHWQVETQHFYQDFVFHQDNDRTVEEISFQNISTVRKMCITLLKIYAAITDKSVNLTRKNMGWAPEKNVCELLNFYDEETLRHALEAPLKKKEPKSHKRYQTYLKEKAAQEAANKNK